jgi:hypothetical protein
VWLSGPAYSTLCTDIFHDQDHSVHCPIRLCHWERHVVVGSMEDVFHLKPMFQLENDVIFNSSPRNTRSNRAINLIVIKKN